MRTTIDQAEFKTIAFDLDDVTIELIDPETKQEYCLIIENVHFLKWIGTAEIEAIKRKAINKISKL